MGTVNPVGMEIKNVEKMTVQTAGSFGQVAAAPTSAVPAVKQVDTISFAGPLAADSYTVVWNGAPLTTVAADGTDNATLVASAINAAAGYTAASVVGTSVVITAPSAGTSQMPTYTITNNDESSAPASVPYPVVGTTPIPGADAVEATGATTAAVYDVSGIADLTDVKVTTAVNVNLKAATTTNVDVSGTTGEVKVDGGKDVTVTDAKAAVTLDNAKGNVTVTDATQTAAITITDGANVTVTATATAAHAISVGTTNNTATGDVVVTQNLNSSTTLTGGAINVVGGKTVTVNVNSTNSSTTGTDITTNAINVTGDANTTAVTVNQTEAVTAVPFSPAVPAVTEVASVQFTPLTNGNTTVLGNLTFTASKDLTAAEVAAAFANLKAGATHGQAKADDGIYTGTFTGEFTSGSVSADNKVVFTATEAKGVTSLVNNGSATVNITTTGATGTDAVTAVGGIVNGQVVISDGATVDTIKTVTVDGYADGSTIASDALTDLTLKNSTATAKMTLTSTVATLNVTLDDVVGTVDLDGTGAATTLKTLNLTTTGEASNIILNAVAVETLTIAAAANLDISNVSTTLNALKTATITGAGDVTLGTLSALANFATLTASAATGDVSATVSGVNTAVTTGAGDDSITVAAATTVTKTINLGAGDDELNLLGITTVNVDTAAISGGEGTDTIVLTAANAATLSSTGNSTVFKSKVTGFEKLDIGATTGITNVNVGNLGFNYVVTNANGAGFLLTLADMANNGTVELNGISAGGTEVEVKDATAGEADELNVIANVANDVNNGTLTAAKVEKINITATDTTPVNPLTGDATIHTSTLKLVAIDATAVAIAGNAHLDLDMAGNTKVTSIDASNLTGDLEVISANITTSATIIGGSGNDNITANNLDKVFGGAGNDTLTADDFAELTGGADADMFVANIATAKNSFATIKDFNKAEGDSIKFTGALDFINTKVDALATFDGTLDAAVVAAGANGVSWFTFKDNATQSTDTYLVYSTAADSTFNAGADTVIKVTGVVDFSTAAFNGTDDTIAFA